MNSKDERDERQASVRFPAPLYEEVAQVAKQQHRSVSGQIIYWVEQGARGRQQEAAA
jgi:hypothetical protein